MIATLAWKTYREQRSVWLALGILALVLFAGVVVFVEPAGKGPVGGDKQAILLLFAAAVTGTYGLVCGSMMLAGEREDRTLDFLDTLTWRRADLWKTKLITGAGLVLAFALLQTLVLVAMEVLALDLDRLLFHVPVYFAALAVPGLIAFAWSMLVSAWSSNVLQSAAGTVLILLPLSVILGAAGSFEAFRVAYRFGEERMVFAVAVAMIVALHGLLALGALTGSRRSFCRVDRLRQRGLLPPRRTEHQRSGASLGWTELVWLTWRSARLPVMALALGPPLLILLGTALWPVVVWLVALACGILVFAPEQADGSFRFLGDQRLPPGRLWTARIGFWLLLAVGVSAVVRTADLLLGEPLLPGQPLPLPLPEPASFILLLAYGFTVAQFFGLLARKTVVAVFLAAVGSAGMLALCFPFLLGGGMSVWPLLVPPVVLLLATRRAMWPWLSGLLTRWQARAVLGAWGVAALVWIGACLTYRAVEVPDLGEPFDVRAFEQSLPTVEQNRAGRLLREAGQELGRELERVPEWKTWLQQLPVLVTRGWPDDSPQLDEALTRLSAGEALKHYREAAALPLGMIQDPLAADAADSQPVQRTTTAVLLLQARALQLQAKDDHEAALEQLTAALGLTRQLRHHAATTAWLTGQQAETDVLATLALWHRNLGDRPKLLRRALDELTRHEAELPPLTDQLKTAYLAAQQEHGSTLASSEAIVLDAPWEKERRTRLLNALFSGWLHSAELNYWETGLDRPATLVQLRGWLKEPPGQRLLRSWVPPPNSEWVLSAEQLASLLNRSGSNWSGLQWPLVRVSTPWSLKSLRSERLKLAQALYTAEHEGKKPATIEALVPDYLREVPVNPLTGAALRLDQPE